MRTVAVAMIRNKVMGSTLTSLGDSGQAIVFSYRGIFAQPAYFLGLLPESARPFDPAQDERIPPAPNARAI